MADLIFLALGGGAFLAFAAFAVLLKRVLAMWLDLLWAAGALGVAAYKVAALLRPDRF